MYPMHVDRARLNDVEPLCEGILAKEILASFEGSDGTGIRHRCEIILGKVGKKAATAQSGGHSGESPRLGRRSGSRGHSHNTQ
jgi:hypothetical protein